MFVAEFEGIFSVESDGWRADFMDSCDSEIRRVGLPHGRPDRDWMTLRVERGE